MHSPIITMTADADTYRFHLRVDDKIFDIDFIDVVKAAPSGDVFDWYSALRYLTEFWEKFIPEGR